MRDDRHPIEWALDQFAHPFGDVKTGMAIMQEFTEAMFKAQVHWLHDPRMKGYWGA